MISLKNDRIYTLVNNVVLLEEEGSTYSNNNLPQNNYMEGPGSDTIKERNPSLPLFSLSPFTS